MAAKDTKVNPFVNFVKITPDAQQKLKQYLLQCKQLAYHQNFPIRSTMLRADQEYMRELDYTDDNKKAKIANASGDARKFRNITVPVVLPQVESAVTYQASVFLTGVPIFGVVSAPDFIGPAKQLETILDNQAIRGGWVDEITMFFRDGEKYNFGIVEAEWTREMLPGFDTDLSSSNNAAKISPIAWDGNKLNRWDPYNTFWDVRYEAAAISKRGEFIGTSEMVSRVELKKQLITDPFILRQNITAALESPTPAVTISADTSILTYFIPQVNQTKFARPQLYNEFNWMAWAGMEPNGTRINYKNIYMRTKLYARIIPSDFGIEVPGKNTPQVWKFIFVNDDILVYAQPVSTAIDTFPVFMSAPNRDGLGYQTKSTAENSIDFQNVTSAMMNSIIAARRRAISDRLLYDPSRVSESNINSDNPSAKIPVRPAAYGKPLGEAVYQFPYKDDQSQIMFSEIQVLLGMADKTIGLNPARQGQFVKGNKTRQEFDSVMANANGRDQMKAMIYECQIFTPLKECLKNNILEKQTPATLYSRDLQAPITVDPVALRKASLQFKVSDGLIPSDKIIAGDTLKDVFNTLSQNPNIGVGYNLAPMFSYLVKTQGADLTPFEKSPQQMAYEQALQAWQQTVQAMMQSMQAALKGMDPQSMQAAMAQLQKSLPPQPLPQNYGFDPGAPKIPDPANNDSQTVLTQVSAILNPPQTPPAGQQSNPARRPPQNSGPGNNQQNPGGQ